MHVFVSFLASDYRMWDKIKHKRFHKVKSIGMQDESLHRGIIQGWTKPVRSAGLFLYAIPGSLPVAHVLVSWPGQCLMWGLPILCLAHYSYQKVFRYILGGVCAAV